MQRLFVRTPIFVLCLLFLFEQVALSSASVAVVPLIDSSSDGTSKELAASFSAALRTRGVEVVDAGIAEAVINYHDADVRTQKECDSVGGLLNDAKEKYFALEFDEAYALASKAVESAQTTKAVFCGTYLRDAYALCGLIVSKQKKKRQEAGEFFKKAVLLDPSFDLSRNDFPPSVVLAFSKTRDEILKNAAGTIEITASPEVAEIYLNGVFKGVSPLTLSGLPSAGYDVEVRANKYLPEFKSVSLAADEKLDLAFDLKWDRNSHKNSAALVESKNAVAEGVRLGGLLNVDKIVTIDADVNPDMSGSAAVRMTDRAYQAGHKQINVVWDSSRVELQESLSSAADLLFKQLSADVSKDPRKYLDADGAGGIILLGQKRRSLPDGVVIGIAGGVIAAIGGGIAWSMMSGSQRNAKTGSINVRFK